eukprot:ANDGO_04603.mRNA.1 Protein transport protein Sec24-like At3g07100
MPAAPGFYNPSAPRLSAPGTATGTAVVAGAVAPPQPPSSAQPSTFPPPPSGFASAPPAAAGPMRPPGGFTSSSAVYSPPPPQPPSSSFPGAAVPAPPMASPFPNPAGPAPTGFAPLHAGAPSQPPPPPSGFANTLAPSPFGAVQSPPPPTSSGGYHPQPSGQPQVHGQPFGQSFQTAQSHQHAPPPMMGYGQQSPPMVHQHPPGPGMMTASMPGPAPPAMGQGSANQHLAQPMTHQQPQMMAASASLQLTDSMLPRRTRPVPGFAPRSAIELSVGVLPAAPSLVSKFTLPVGAIVTPLHILPSEDGTIGRDTTPVVHFGSCGVVRCRRCRAYVNPFVAFTDSGRRWICNLCRFANDVPPEYYSPVDSQGVRVDIAQRPELSVTSVEFLAPAEYMVRPPQPPCFVFVIDVSTGVAQESLPALSQALASCVGELPGDTRTLVSIVCFDSAVHLFTVDGERNSFRISTIADPHPAGAAPTLPKENSDGSAAASPFMDDGPLCLPAPVSSLLVPVKDALPTLQKLILSLPRLFPSQSVSAQCCTGTALHYALRIMGGIGGKLVLFQGSLPTLGRGALLPEREDFKLYGTDKEKNLLEPAEKYYKDLALECSRLQVGVDVVLLAPNTDRYTDVATLAVLARVTGGALIRAPPQSSARRANVESENPWIHDGRLRSLLCPAAMALEAVMRVRPSLGLRCTDFFGNFYLRSTDLLALPNVSANQSFGVIIQHAPSASGGPQVVPTPVAYLQAALLYTSTNGERRIRVHNIQLPVSNALSEVVDSVNSRVLADLVARQAATAVLAGTQKLQQVRLGIQDACVFSLRSVRGMFQTSYPGQDVGSLVANGIVPRNMSTYPLYALALLKHSAFRADTDVRADERIEALQSLLFYSSDANLSPVMINLSRFFSSPELTGLECTVPLSRAYLDTEAAYLLVYGPMPADALVWLGAQCTIDAESVGRDARFQRLLCLFGIKSVPAENWVSEGGRPIPLSANMSSVASSQFSQKAEKRFYRYLVEDRGASAMSYLEFMQFLVSNVPPK